MNKKEIGNIGEDAAAKYLQSKGYTIQARNYFKPWGEIDIVAHKGSTTHFIEVKSISRENIQSVSQNTEKPYAPEENFHVKKAERFQRIAETYVQSHQSVGEWQLDLITTVIFIKDKKIHIQHIENVL